MLMIIYRLIALLILVFSARDFWKEENPQLKICACFAMVPLLLRVLWLK